MIQTIARNSYTVVHVPGWGGPTDHFGKEIAARCAAEYPTLEDARRALVAAKAGHNHGNHKIGRIDIVRGDGTRVRWA